jgi:hypothetical protein
MCEQQYQAEVLDELKQQDYNTNVGTKGERSVATFVFSRRNSSTDGQVNQVGQKAVYPW